MCAPLMSLKSSQYPMACFPCCAFSFRRYLEMPHNACYTRKESMMPVKSHQALESMPLALCFYGCGDVYGDWSAWRILVSSQDISTGRPSAFRKRQLMRGKRSKSWRLGVTGAQYQDSRLYKTQSVPSRSQQHAHQRRHRSSSCLPLTAFIWLPKEPKCSWLPS